MISIQYLNRIGLFSLYFLLSLSSFSQGSLCLDADPFCSDSPETFPASTGAGAAQPGPNYGCLGSQPNPAWYFLQIGQSGNLSITLTPSPLVDIDFILWGPFTDPSSPCVAQLTAANIVSCSFSAQAIETATIPNGQTGEFYLLMITNFSNQPTNVNVTQTSGTGSTDCSILIPCDLEVDAGTGGAVCVGEPFQLNGSHQNEEGNVTYQWTSAPAGAINDLDNTSILNPTFTPSQNYGNVTFTLSVTDDGPNLGPCTISDDVVVTFRPLPTITVNPNVCPGSEATFVISGSPGDSIDYTINGQPGTVIIGTSGQTSINSPSASSDQTMEIIGGALGICPLTVDDLNDIADATALLAPISIDTLIQFPADCGLSNGNATAQVSGLTGTPFYTFTGPSPSNAISVNGTVLTNIPSGWYTFTVTDNLCTLTDSIFVEQTPPPTADFTPNPSEGNAPLDVTFINNSSGASTYFWDFDNGNTNTVSNTSNQNQTYTQEGEYLVMLVATEGACSDTAYRLVIVNLLLPLIYDMPNIFTPNGDGTNDFFTLNAENAVELEMIITNRWGNVVFDSEDLNPSWNGQDKSGKDCSPGVYFYKFRIMGMDGEEKTEHGFVHLVRE